MRKQTWLIWLCIILGMALSGCQLENGFHREEKIVLKGKVMDDASGKALWNGTVELNGMKTYIDHGVFHIENLSPGPHIITVAGEFYKTKQVHVSLNKGTQMVDIYMTPIFSAADLDLFARMVHAEARGEIYTGQVAVAASILNRVRHHNYPNTLRGVLTQRTNGYANYSPIDDGSINLPANESARNAVRDALVGWDPSLGATGFFAPAKVPNRNNWVWRQVPIIDIGNHRFFRAVID